ncbi:endonuclease [Thiocapsa imhoffii]|uniref:Endonuclease n=1 Tax=Thiocapsa imhoffii TaxID=382777 RepID=A0A9X1B8T7_9GAMM|nr:endonuclease [Thiocapsa imhoffii]MBK1644598.1 endonuclease [Thiocapsa imhoffii]
MEQLALRAIHARLLAHFGPQQWWPAESAFEVMIGAILTQNTAWTNVERALTRLRARVPLTAAAILALAEPELAEALRPSGYYHLKTMRVRAFCSAYEAGGGFSALAARDTHSLRTWLLAVKGIGPETADDILLYAFDRPVFVVDAYTRRLFSRLGLLPGKPGYESIRHAFEQALGPDVDLFKEYHALIVSQGKTVCRQRPRCGLCAVASLCAAASSDSLDPSPETDLARARHRGPTPFDE